MLILAYDLGNFVGRLTLPESVKHWSLTPVQTRLIKMGERLVFQLAGVLVTREMLPGILVLSQPNCWQDRDGEA